MSVRRGAPSRGEQWLLQKSACSSSPAGGSTAYGKQTQKQTSEVKSSRRKKQTWWDTGRSAWFTEVAVNYTSERPPSAPTPGEFVGLKGTNVVSREKRYRGVLE